VQYSSTASAIQQHSQHGGCNTAAQPARRVQYSSTASTEGAIQQHSQHGGCNTAAQPARRVQYSSTASAEGASEQHSQHGGCNRAAQPALGQQQHLERNNSTRIATTKCRRAALHQVSSIDLQSTLPREKQLLFTSASAYVQLASVCSGPHVTCVISSRRTTIFAGRPACKSCFFAHHPIILCCLTPHPLHTSCSC
jgi:hypothetical protein